MITLALFALQTVAVPQPDGAFLREGESCYTIANGGTPLGVTWQNVRASEDAGTPVWDITVHQRLADGSFDLRDNFILRRSDLQPVRMTSYKAGEQHALVAYADGMIATIRPDKPALPTCAAGTCADTRNVIIPRVVGQQQHRFRIAHGQ